MKGGRLGSVSKGEYRFEQRPSETSHGHPVLVFDGDSRIHLPLTVFAKAAFAQLAPETARVYLYALLPFFTFLDQDVWQVRSGRRWDSEPGEVRKAVDDYLVRRLQCQVGEHRLGFQLVAITAGARSHIHIFLSALKLFYRITCPAGYYPFDNPLVDVKAAAAIADAQNYIEKEGDAAPPRMPELSGVVEPRHPRRRLSDSYFKMVGEEWVPLIIDDPDFPSLISRGGDIVGWRLRERCVTDLLFETGARISEVVGLTLGDWEARGLTVEADAFSKGTRGRRVKFLRFSSNTAKLLRRYFNTERRERDPHGYTLGRYLQVAIRESLDLDKVPLFLTVRRRPLTPKVYRDHYWKPACEAAGLDADVHQTRHWYVTRAIRHIHETSTDEVEIARRVKGLIAYMKWKSEETIEAYEHYFRAAQYVEETAAALLRSDRALNLNLEGRRRGTLRPRRVDSPDEKLTDPDAEQETLDFDYLCRIGGMIDE